MGNRTCSILQAVALVSCLFVTMHPASDHMDGMRRAVETVSKSKR